MANMRDSGSRDSGFESRRPDKIQMINTITILLLVTLYLFLLGAFITGTLSGLRGVPWLPTRKGEMQRFLKIANIKKGEKVYDLGCGDGRVVFAVAEQGGDVTGLEISILPFLIATAGRAFQKNKRRIKILCRDMWKADLQDADTVYFYLLPKFYPRLKEKLERELKKGAKVVVHSWPVEGWKPVVVDKKKGEQSFFLYKM